jgi:hypothetical protein
LFTNVKLGWKRTSLPHLETNNLDKNLMEQRDLKNVNNYLNAIIYSPLETSGGQSSNLYLNVVQLFNTIVN